MNFHIKFVEQFNHDLFIFETQSKVQLVIIPYKRD